MDVRIRFQGGGESPWMNKYLESKLSHLGRYLPSDSLVFLIISQLAEKCSTELVVRTPKREYIFTAEGNDVFESFSEVLEESSKYLRIEHAKLKLRIHRKFTEAEGFLL